MQLNSGSNQLGSAVPASKSFDNLGSINSASFWGTVAPKVISYLFVIALGLEGEELLEQGGKDGGLGLAVAQRQPQRFQSRRPESEQAKMRLLRPVRSGQRIVLIRSVRPVRRRQSGKGGI